MDMNDQEIKKKINQKLMRLIESDDETIINEHKISGEGATINITHNCSICLLMYLYLMDKNDAPTKELKELEDQINKLEKKTQDFNKMLINLASDIQ